MNARYFVPVVFAILALYAPALHAQVDPVAAARNAMRERVAVIDELKTAGHVGEGNDGRLVARGGGQEVARVVEAENADRAVVFADTARRTGTTPQAVARTFARQIAVASQSGVWLQREDGTWYRK